MKLIGSYTSPFVRKISVILLEKGITFEFINEQPYSADSGVGHYNPLGRSLRNTLTCWVQSRRCCRTMLRRR